MFRIAFTLGLRWLLLCPWPSPRDFWAVFGGSCSLSAPPAWGDAGVFWRFVMMGSGENVYYGCGQGKRSEPAQVRVVAARGDVLRLGLGRAGLAGLADAVVGIGVGEVRLKPEVTKETVRMEGDSVVDTDPSVFRGDEE